MLNNEVKARIESGIMNSKCLVSEFSGGSDHYSIIVISDTFEGKASLSRHRMIMDLFHNEVSSGEVHALTIKAFTLKQWDEQQKQESASESRMEIKN